MFERNGRLTREGHSWPTRKRSSKQPRTNSHFSRDQGRINLCVAWAITSNSSPYPGLVGEPESVETSPCGSPNIYYFPKFLPPQKERQMRSAPYFRELVTMGISSSLESCTCMLRAETDNAELV